MALNNFKYNFSLVGTPIGDSYLPKNEEQRRLYYTIIPVHVFNTKSHLTASFLFRFILHPAFNLLMKNLNDSIHYEADLVRLSIIFGMSIYLSILFLCYLICWRPFESKLNVTIFKTKKMLCIIPKEVLMAIKNINVLLALDNTAFLNNQAIER